MKALDPHAAYLQKLRERSKESRVYRDYQLVGLELADLLGDRVHKSLYIRLAKTNNHSTLLGLARDIADRTNVKKPGAYFMKLLTEKKASKRTTKPD